MSRLFGTGFIGESHRGALVLKIHQLFLIPHINTMFLFWLLLLQQLGMFVISVKPKVKATFTLDKTMKDFFLLKKFQINFTESTAFQ